MADRDRVVTYLDEPLMADFEDWIAEHYGETDGNRAKALRLAVRELINGHAGDGGTDEIAAMNDKLDEVLTHVREQSSTHTHKQSTRSDVDKIVARAETEGTPITETRLEQIIIETRDLDVGDDRTLRRWKARIRQSEALFELPEGEDADQDRLWTDDRKKWVIGVEALNPVEQTELIERHGLTTSEFDELCSIEHPAYDEPDMSNNDGAQLSTPEHTEAADRDMSDNDGAQLSIDDDDDADDILNKLEHAEPAED